MAEEWRNTPLSVRGITLFGAFALGFLAVIAPDHLFSGEKNIEVVRPNVDSGNVDTEIVLEDGPKPEVDGHSSDRTSPVPALVPEPVPERGEEGSEGETTDRPYARADQDRLLADPLFDPYETDTIEALENYVPYVSGSIGWSAEVGHPLDSVCFLSSWSDNTGTAMPIACISIHSEEILHLGVFPDDESAYDAIYDYLQYKPEAHYIYEQVTYSEVLVIMGSEEAIGPLFSQFGYHIYFPRDYP